MTNWKLSSYINILAKHGFKIEQLIEDSGKVAADAVDTDRYYSERKAQYIHHTFVIKARKLYGIGGGQNLYFSRTNTSEPYANPKSRDEVEKLLVEEANEHSNFVFAAVKGDYGKEIIPMYKYVILLEVPKEIRLQRIRNRSFEKFGNRMLAGGDLHEQEEAFFVTVDSRKEDFVENWVRTLSCPVMRVDGAKVAFSCVFVESEY